MPLRLNPTLDPGRFAAAFAEDRFVQIPNVFESRVADEIEKWLLSISWRLLVQDENKQNTLLTMKQLAEMSAGDRQALEKHIRDRAASTFGYTYYAYPLRQATLENWDPHHPIHQMIPFMNSAPFLELARTVTGSDTIRVIDAHATNYQKGHYLVRHVDPGDLHERRAAFTLSFSRDWQPDWGGLLLFLDGKLDVVQGFLPRFNVLTIFDGAAMEHNVSALSTFAPRPRLSFAGWFRDK